MTDGMVRADFVTAVVLIALGGAVVAESLRMPRFAELDINPYTVPGLVPGVLGVVLLLLGAALLVRAMRAGGWRLFGRGARSSGWADPGTPNLILAVVLCVGYAAGLIGRVPFWLATFLFVALFVVAFEWGRARGGREQVQRLAFAVAFGGLVAAAVTLIFQEVFLVRLP
jgi:putative tricarboxylic transport membrane protein